MLPLDRRVYYRAYIIGQDGHFLEAVNLDCANDAAAIESGKQFVDGRDVEVWQSDRMVAKLARCGVWPPPSVHSPDGTPFLRKY